MESVGGKEPVWLRGIEVSHYRNLQPAGLAFSPRFNILAGQNAQGKTSLLEAVYLLSSSQVLRGTRDVEAIQEGADGATVKGEIEPGTTAIAVELAAGKRKKASINGIALPRASDLIGRMPAVCFWSGDLALATGDPAFRRLMLDTEISQIYPGYLKAFGVYKRALQQRNALLKTAHERFVPNELFEGWEAQMASAGSQMRSYRMRWVEAIRPVAAQTHAFMGLGEVLEVGYAVKEPGDLADLYATARNREIARGASLFGPHRDDLDILIDGRPARQFGSQGQQRTAVISLKLAVQSAAQETLGFPPVLLLDDIFSDLDEGRRHRLVESAMGAGGQVFVTCTESGQAGESLLGHAKLFSVESGCVREV
ncbi:MAG: DNA replication/repair protein RecF [Armatimonadetes bacterium]|nr:DNA replication/repair protein RecF [Armatimonadota bacterium]MBX3108293.1 DNA replication/repair protein RecF [Fimbriimonadaceae bacterium]